MILPVSSSAAESPLKPLKNHFFPHPGISLIFLRKIGSRRRCGDGGTVGIALLSQFTFTMASAVLVLAFGIGVATDHCPVN